MTNIKQVRLSSRQWPKVGRTTANQHIKKIHNINRPKIFLCMFKVHLLRKRQHILIPDTTFLGRVAQWIQALQLKLEH